jgi:hypothetical protein
MDVGRKRGLSLLEAWLQSNTICDSMEVGTASEITLFEMSLPCIKGQVAVGARTMLTLIAAPACATYQNNEFDVTTGCHSSSIHVTR